MSKLIMIVGPSGSGKSTLAEKIIRQSPEKRISHFEADMFFMRNGSYKFDPSKLSEAHKWCQDSVRNALTCSDTVIVSNTFTRAWERKPYLDMVREIGCDLDVIKLNTMYGNTHGVPAEVVQRMLNNFEQITDEELEGVTNVRKEVING